ncbi:MAG: C4-dicarboxylate transporter [Clostridiales bacterium]|jgi:TRAP transporter 4TM/12TM fusion protein|nr:C4-dicarboxylate transporter [Clostridiales bacterium]
MEPEKVQANIDDFGEERELAGFWKKFVYIVTALMAGFHIYFLGFKVIDPWVLRLAHLQFVVIIGFLYFPGWKKAKKNVHIVDLILIVLSLSTLVYVLNQFDKIIFRAGVVPTTLDVVFGAFAIITVVELTRRTTGKALPILVALFFLYALVGPYLPGMLWHKGYSLERVISFLFSKTGIYNIPLGVTARFVYLFILFGAFLEICGTGKFFMDFSYAVAGKTRGGPAKVAVISSGLFGMINGTSTGNVVTTGSFTIPLMKNVGYSGYFAGAVEACASTGGQIMPPVMGAAAFLMAQLIGVPYVDIMFAAIIPAILYYLAIFLMVDMEAVRLGLKGLPKEEIPSLKEVVKTVYLALPLFVILYYLIIIRSSIVLAGLAGIASCFVIYILINLPSGKKIKLKDILEVLHEGGKNVVRVSTTCASAGIIMGILTLTGLGMKVASIIINLSQGNLFLALFLTMIVCIILGMGLPTIAAYAITASVVAPALIKLGVPEIPTHLFVLYFSCLSAITPPVCLASYAAAAIARVKPLKLAFVGLKLGVAGYIIPYMFVYGPSLLLYGGAGKILLTTVSATLGVIALAIAIQGYLWGNISKISRILFFVVALSLIKPGLTTDIVGFALFIILLPIQRKKLSEKIFSNS